MADALYWLALDDRGRLQLRPGVFGLALAAGLLGELIIDRKVTVWEGKVVVCARQPPAEPLSAFLYEEILKDPDRDPLTWLAAVRRIASQKVIARLQRENLLAPGGERRGRRYRASSAGGGVPVNRRVAALPWAVLSNRLHRREPVNEAEAFVIAVALASGLANLLLEGAPPVVHRHAGDIVSGLSGPLAQVLAQAETAVGNDVLTHRF